MDDYETVAQKMARVDTRIAISARKRRRKALIETRRQRDELLDVLKKVQYRDEWELDHHTQTPDIVTYCNGCNRSDGNHRADCNIQNAIVRIEGEIPE